LLEIWVTKPEMFKPEGFPPRGGRHIHP
jgi:hypothetical protein